LQQDIEATDGLADDQPRLFRVTGRMNANLVAIGRLGSARGRD